MSTSTLHRYEDPGERVRTSRTLAMFPGQGSQRAGMARHLIQNHPRTAGRVFTEADEVLELPLTELCTTGAPADLMRTEITQPAIVATSLAVYVALSEAGFQPDVVAGHSLGEYTALVAAEVLTAADALRLVRRRGELMAQTARRVPGKMVAVFGLPCDQVEDICDSVIGLGFVQVANYNEPRQTVISGTVVAVRAAAQTAAIAGAEKVVELDVAAPFHCRLMRDIERDFTAELLRYPFAEPQRPMLSSVTGRFLGDATEAKHLLREQLSGPVRWTDVLRAAQCDAVTDYIEIGPGRVLSGLANRMIPDASVRSTNDDRRVAALLRDIQTPNTVEWKGNPS